MSRNVGVFSPERVLFENLSRCTCPLFPPAHLISLPGRVGRHTILFSIFGIDGITAIYKAAGLIYTDPGRREI